jgi:hypothetical protein
MNAQGHPVISQEEEEKSDAIKELKKNGHSAYIEVFRADGIRHYIEVPPNCTGLSFGRSVENDIMINCRLVSFHRHCEIRGAELHSVGSNCWVQGEHWFPVRKGEHTPLVHGQYFRLINPYVHEANLINIGATVLFRFHIVETKNLPICLREKCIIEEGACVFRRVCRFISILTGKCVG